jgi:hypothetical protein
MGQDRHNTGHNGGAGPAHIGEGLTTALDKLSAQIKGAHNKSESLSANKRMSGVFQAAKESWLKTVARHPNLSGADCAVAIAISTYLNSKKGIAWPSIETLACDTNRYPSTVWRSVKKLESFSLLAVERDRGRKHSNRYRFVLGHLDRDPKTLRRRNKKTARSQQKDCELAVRTLE